MTPGVDVTRTHGPCGTAISESSGWLYERGFEPQGRRTVAGVYETLSHSEVFLQQTHAVEFLAWVVWK